jgi:peptidoglycan/LPS O-acetylase OafA/YrhL
MAITISNGPTHKPDTFPALNGLRFLAAIAVVFFHYATEVEGYSQAPKGVQHLINLGPAAVGFFFILSGFVLAYRHLQRPRVETTASFYWARVVRLYPAYLVAFLLFAPIAAQKYLVHPHPSGHRTFALSAALSGLMLQAWTPLSQAWNGPSWSLSVEAFMYLIFPFAALRVLRLNSKKATSLFLAGWLVPAGLASAFAAGLIPEKSWDAIIRNNPLVWAPLFLIGICAVRFIPALSQVSKRVANVISTTLFVAVVLAGLLWPVKWSEVFITGGIAPLLVAMIVCFTRESGWLTRLVGSKAFDGLGQVSYNIYILQSPVWHYWQVFTNRLAHLPLETEKVASWQFVLFLPVLILASLAVQRFVEIPVRQFLRTPRLSAQRKTRPQPEILMEKPELTETASVAE